MLNTVLVGPAAAFTDNDVKQLVHLAATLKLRGFVPLSIGVPAPEEGNAEVAAARQTGVKIAAAFTEFAKMEKSRKPALVDGIATPDDEIAGVTIYDEAALNSSTAADLFRQIKLRTQDPASPAFYVVPKGPNSLLRDLSWQFGMQTGKDHYTLSHGYAVAVTHEASVWSQIGGRPVVQDVGPDYRTGVWCPVKQDTFIPPPTRTCAIK